jgi:acyl dehydratase
MTMNFADLTVGATLGSAPFVLSEQEAAQWIALFPRDARYLPTMPRAMMSMITMRAFMHVMKDRPKGNVHAGQNVDLMALPQMGDLLTTTIRCIDKTMKNGRRWVNFETQTLNERGAPLFRGTMNMIWAA